MPSMKTPKSSPRKRLVKNTDEDEDDSFDESMYTSTPHPGQGSKAIFSPTNWPHHDMTQLIERVKSQCPEDDDKMTFKTRLAKIDWSNVAFDHYTPDECQAKWVEISSNVRTMRTLSEICDDAANFIRTGKASRQAKKKKKLVDPDKPKKPVTPFLAFLMDFRARNSELCNKAKVDQIAKLASQEFAKLPEKKKSKYTQKYQEELQNYRDKMLEYKQNHPIADIDEQKYGISKPEPPKGPIHFYLKKLIKKKLIDPTVTKAEQLEAAKGYYLALKDGKKIKLIRKAAADERRYRRELDEFREENPDIKIAECRSALTKAEKELKAIYDGKPAKPPRSGYHLFLQEQLEGIAPGDRVAKMSEVGKLWREMEKSDQDDYNQRAAQAVDEYKEAMTAYLMSLPEDERDFELDMVNGNGKRKRQYVKLDGFIKTKQARVTKSQVKEE